MSVRLFTPRIKSSISYQGSASRAPFYSDGMVSVHRPTQLRGPLKFFQKLGERRDMKGDRKMKLQPETVVVNKENIT